MRPGVNKALRTRMDKSGITLTDLAEHLKMDGATLSKWIDEPLDKQKADIIYQAMDEIYYHRTRRKEKYWLF